MQKKLIVVIIIICIYFNLLKAASPTFNFKGGTTFDLNGRLELKEGIESGELKKIGDKDVTVKLYIETYTNDYQLSVIPNLLNLATAIGHSSQNISITNPQIRSFISGSIQIPSSGFIFKPNIVDLYHLIKSKNSKENVLDLTCSTIPGNHNYIVQAFKDSPEIYSIDNSTENITLQINICTLFIPSKDFPSIATLHFIGGKITTLEGYNKYYTAGKVSIENKTTLKIGKNNSIPSCPIEVDNSNLEIAADAVSIESSIKAINGSAITL